MYLGTASRTARRGGRALTGLGPLPGYRSLSNSEYRSQRQRGSETVGAKLHSREGNSPDRRLRPLKVAQSLRMWGFEDSQDVGLEAAII